MELAGLIIISIGVFSICGAVFNWGWFMYASEAWVFTTLLGRTGARIFFLLLGCGFIVLGVLFAIGVIPDLR